MWFRATGQICPEAVYSLEPSEKVVALTIDDGPDEIRTGTANTTRQILQVLSKHQSHATFFLISSRITPESQPLVEQMVREGHELGNHLRTDYASVKLPLKTFEAAVDEADLKIRSAANAKTSVSWLRPGGGFCNKQMAKIIRQKNYKAALGSIWPYDTLISSTQFSIWQILSNVRPGAIIILHDHGPEGAWGQRTVETLEQVLPELKRRGYRVESLSEVERASHVPE